MQKLTVIACAAALCVAAGAEEQIEITPIEARATIRGPEQAYTPRGTTILPVSTSS